MEINTEMSGGGALLHGAVMMRARLSSGMIIAGSELRRCGKRHICPARIRRRTAQVGRHQRFVLHSSRRGGGGQRDPAFIIVHQRGVLQVGTGVRCHRRRSSRGVRARAYSSRRGGRGVQLGGIQHEALHHGGEMASSFIKGSCSSDLWVLVCFDQAFTAVILSFSQTCYDIVLISFICL